LWRRQKLAVEIENVLGNSVGEINELSATERDGGVDGVSLEVVSDE
jgi:hypothetical protein